MSESTRPALPLRERAAFTLAEVSQLTGIPRRTLQDEISRGTLEAVYRCRRWLVRREALDAWLSDR